MNAAGSGALVSARSSDPRSQPAGNNLRREKVAIGTEVDAPDELQRRGDRRDSTPSKTHAVRVGRWLAARLGDSGASGGVNVRAFAISNALVCSRSKITSTGPDHTDPQRLQRLRSVKARPGNVELQPGRRDAVARGSAVAVAAARQRHCAVALVSATCQVRARDHGPRAISAAIRPYVNAGGTRRRSVSGGHRRRACRDRRGLRGERHGHGASARTA